MTAACTACGATLRVCSVCGSELRPNARPEADTCSNACRARKRLMAKQLSDRIYAVEPEQAPAILHPKALYTLKGKKP